jgi:hypothetical protein
MIKKTKTTKDKKDKRRFFSYELGIMSYESSPLGGGTE